MIALVRNATDALTLFQEFRQQIEAQLNRDEPLDVSARNLALQNENPVKVLTSGIEMRADKPFEVFGKVRSEARFPWWNDYADEVFCVFGHYERTAAGDGEGHLFDGRPPNASLGNGYAMCIDYGIANRWEERLLGQSGSAKLGALRFPEKVIVFDDGERVPLVNYPSKPRNRR
jgi:hypothetical protein